MVNSMYNFADVEAKTASPITIKEIIKSVLRADGGNCYSEMEKYLIAPGISGSRQFDQHAAVIVLLKHDSELDGAISAFMAETPTLKARGLWDILHTVLRLSGFKMQHGRLTGLLEHKPTKSDNGDEDGQPDID